MVTLSGGISSSDGDGAAKAFLRKKLKEFLSTRNSVYTQKPQKPSIDTVTFTNQDRTEGRLSSGQTVKVVASGCPQQTDIGYLQPDGSYLVHRDCQKIIYITSPSDAPWFLFAVGGAIPAPGNPSLSFPEFVLANGTTLNCYRIKNTDLTTLFSTTDNGFNGTWRCKMSPDLSTIVLTRVTQDTTTFTESFVGGTGSITTYESRIYWAILSGFKLDTANQVVDLTTAVVTQGNHKFNYAGPTFTIPAHPTTYSIQYSTFGIPVINFLSGSIAAIDIVGEYRSHIDTLSPSFSDTQGGVWLVNNLSESYLDFGNPGGGNHLVVPTINGQVFAVNKEFYSSSDTLFGAGLAFRDSNNNTGMVAFRRSTANSAYYMNPYGSIVFTAEDFTDLFLVDAARHYSTFNTDTGWTAGGSNLIKVTSNGNFLEYKTVGSDAVLQGWVYNSSTFSMGKGSSTTTTFPVGFKVPTSTGLQSITNVMDWIIK